MARKVRGYNEHEAQNMVAHGFLGLLSSLSMVCAIIGVAARATATLVALGLGSEQCFLKRAGGGLGNGDPCQQESPEGTPTEVAWWQDPSGAGTGSLGASSAPPWE